VCFPAALYSQPHLHVYGCVVEARAHQRLQPCQVWPHVVGAVAGEVGDDQQTSLNGSRVAGRGKLLEAAARTGTTQSDAAERHDDAIADCNKRAS
jgi:hypothetical protein